MQPQAARTNSPAGNTNGIRIPAAAAALKKLNPDVILLQQVTDWAMCEELAQALKPAKYNVVVCSAFRDARAGTLRKQQVAILAKAKAYYSWSEPWRNRGVPALPGGLAFAAFQVGNQRVGLFSIQAGTVLASAAGKQQGAASLEERLGATVEQLLAQVGSVSNWVANRVQVFVVGGTFGLVAGQTMALQDMPLQLLQDAGFGDAFQDTPAAERATMWARAGQVGATSDYIFTQPANCTTNPTVMRVAVSRRYPVTCDVELGPAAAAGVAQTTRVEASPAGEPRPRSSPPSEVKAQPKPVETASAPPPTQTAERPLQPAAQVEPAAKPPIPQPTPPLATLPQPSTRNPQLLWLATGVILTLGTAVVWTLARHRRARRPAGPALLTAGGDSPSGYTVVMGSRSAAESASPDRRSAPAARPLIHMEAPGTTHTQTEALRQRALAAEQQAARANALVRAGLIPHLGRWLKQKLVRKLIADRAQLLNTQQAAARTALAVEERLARIEQQIQRQNHSYQERIEELTRELLVAKEENRELIRARIAQVKAEMAAARERLLAQSQSGG